MVLAVADQRSWSRDAGSPRLEGGLNTYRYVHGNPVEYSDPTVTATVRGSLAGFSGNTTGQLVTGGPANDSLAEALTQAVIGGAAGAYGNALGLGYALNAVRGGTTSAMSIPTSFNVGTTGNIGMSAALNMLTPTNLGGMNPACGCQ